MSKTDARAARVALEQLLAGTAWRLPEGFADAAERYVGLLLEANARLNLTRVVQPEAVARLHLLDALAALPLIDRDVLSTAVDLGSGGGVPGLVLALARPEMRWTLVDSVHKKADAVAAMATALGATNVEVVADRAELLGRSRREAFDLVTARALAPLAVLVEYGLPLLRVGGTVLAWKGPVAAAELEAGARASAQLGGSEPVAHATGVEALGDHRFVVVRKLGPTPDRFPRRPGQASRRPLAG